MNLNHIYENRKQYYITPTASARGSVYLCLVLGALGIGLGLFRGHSDRVWGSYLFNLFFFFSIGLGGMAFGAMQDIIGAVWGRPIRRLHEAFGAFVPVAIVLFVVYLVAVGGGIAGAGDIYSWIKDPEQVAGIFGKSTWLQKNFMLARDLGALAVIGALVAWQFKLSLTKDLLFIDGKRADAAAAGEAARASSRYWSAPVLVCYAITFSLLGFDLLMSLEPMWMSTLFGGWLFAIMMQTLMAMLIIVMFTLKNSAIGEFIGRQQFHDVGKLLHGFTVFFGYLTYAHILTYWYGNMPEETEYFLHRLHAPWIYVVLTIPVIGFAIPLYTLVFKAAKWSAGVVIPLAILILSAQWLSYLLVVMPAVTDGAKWQLPWVELLVFCGFLGLFLKSYFWFGERFPMISMADPLLPKALEAEHH